MQHTVLAVCEGNICRSPAAQFILPALTDGSIIAVSAGTRAAVGHPVDPQMSQLLLRDGYQPTGFSAQQLNTRIIAEATIIITMTVQQRDQVVSLAPSVAQRTFTVLELAHLLSAAPVLPDQVATDGARWAAIPRLVAGIRHHGTTRSVDIADPFRQPPQRYVEAYEAITQGLSDIVTALRRPAPRWDPWHARRMAKARPDQQPPAGPPSPRHARR